MSVFVTPGFFGAQYPLIHGRVCWQTHVGTVAADSEASGFPAINALPPRTDAAWRPTAATGEWSITYAAAETVSYVGIAKHDLGSLSATLAVEYLASGVWTAFGGMDAVEPEVDDPLLFLVPPTSCDGVRIRITAADAAPTLAVIAAGVADEWPRPFVWPGRPITEGDQVRFENTISLTGNWLGRSVQRDGLQFELTMNNASEHWRQTTFNAFKAHANGEDATFFVAARPGDYPNEVAYAWAAEVLIAERALPNRAASTVVTLICQGLRPVG